MGYELHITRAKHWAENEDHQISAEEWLSIVANDDELILDTTNGPYFANWSGSSTYSEPWFDWIDGDIFTKNPDRAIFEKMLLLAKKLNAKVQGDEGECYNNIEDFPDISQPIHEPLSDLYWWQRIPYYKRKEYLQNFIIYVLIAAVIISVNVFDIW